MRAGGDNKLKHLIPDFDNAFSVFTSIVYVCKRSVPAA